VTYRPITDVWILARPKVKYYGAYPSGFLERARALLGVTTDDAVLHVCSGKVRDYPFRGLGPNDKTLDIDGSMNPDFVADCRKFLPHPNDSQLGTAILRSTKGPDEWPAILADPPYTEQDAAHYSAGPDWLPKPQDLLKLCLFYVRPGGRIGILHYQWPRPPEKIGRYPIKCVALVAVIAGYANNIRAFSVFEKVKG
jgi:hypothetical protein